DFALIGDDVAAVACEVVDRLLTSGGELVTLVTGADAEPGLAESVTAYLRRARPEVETVVYAADVPDSMLLIGVE
ncbi:MAG TPA: dihydroxyacetone kinase, partial [Pseudonocardiaceae bacterium]|nr:dihydroxyacetone kinase [Pseudonocardiaceae bacterium]